MENEITVLDFFTAYCMPCNLLAKDLDVVSKDYPHMKIEKLEINDNYDLTVKYNIMTVPTLIVIKGDKVNSYVGYKGMADLKKFLVENYE